MGAHEIQWSKFIGFLNKTLYFRWEGVLACQVNTQAHFTD